MSSFSDYLENLMLEVWYRNTAFTRPDPVYISLHSGNPLETGGNELAVANGYARQAMETGANTAFSAAVGGVTDNVNAITFGPATPSAWSDVVGVGIWDAATAGNLLEAAWLSNEGWVFTAANTGDLFTAYGHTLVNNDRVILQTELDSVLPTGVSANTIYYVIGVSGATFQLSLTQGGAAITLTADGGGSVHRIQVKSVGVNDTFSFPAGNLDIQRL